MNQSEARSRQGFLMRLGTLGLGATPLLHANPQAQSPCFLEIRLHQKWTLLLKKRKSRTFASKILLSRRVTGLTWDLVSRLGTRPTKYLETFNFFPCSLPLLHLSELRKFCQFPKIYDCSTIAPKSLTFSLKEQSKPVIAFLGKVVGERTASNLYVDLPVGYIRSVALEDFELKQ